MHRLPVCSWLRNFQQNQEQEYQYSPVRIIQIIEQTLIHYMGELPVQQRANSIVASSVTIGFGGSVGAEAPIVLTGAAIGSNLGRLFRMEQKTSWFDF